MWDESNRSIRILLVEDAPFLRHAFGRLLQLHGFDVVEADNGQDALERLKDFTPDLIVTDLMMPVMDGVEMIERLRDNPATAALPILVVTADPSRQSEERARRAGVADFLSKPVDLPVLLERLHSYKP